MQRCRREVPTTCTLCSPCIASDNGRSEEKLLRCPYRCATACVAHKTYILPEPRGLVSASSLRKVPLVGCQEHRDAIWSLRFATSFSCYFFTFNFLEFHRSLAERERTSCRFPELLSEWFGSVGRVFYERKTTELVPRSRQTASRPTRVNVEAQR